jgi:hypothetical protein
VHDRGAQSDARGAAQVIDHGAQAIARGGAGCAPQVLDRGAQADGRSDAQALGRGAQAMALGVARRASQVLDRGAQAAARGAARCLSQAHDRGAQAVAHGAATLPQQENINSADEQRSRANITGFIRTVERRRSRRRWRFFRPHLRRLRMRHNISAWASGGPAEGRRLAEEEQNGR